MHASLLRGCLLGRTRYILRHRLVPGAYSGSVGAHVTSDNVVAPYSAVYMKPSFWKMVVRSRALTSAPTHEGQWLYSEEILLLVAVVFTGFSRSRKEVFVT